jgi:hypothetical protein
LRQSNAEGASDANQLTQSNAEGASDANQLTQSNAEGVHYFQPRVASTLG